jgi:DNA polymerase-3 subunit gamma/tau
MSKENTVLYRKYRPESFAEVFGQDHIVKVLEGSLKLDKIGHAYLFSGPRGTGKTTIARIFARALGCSQNDIIEIDAASNNGVDDIRDLKDAVGSLPFDSPKKVYIIDEVHMLSKSAFNALLKTLEEPPSHVVFVLATTELHKVLPTVVSRCQSFVFKSPTENVLIEMIKNIAKQEGYTVEDDAAQLIAMLGNGSFRDTQGVLQKLVSYSSDTVISRDEVELVTGAPSNQLIQNLINAINEKDTDKALSTVAQAEEGNIDASIFMQMVIHTVRTILLIRFSPAQKTVIKEQTPDEWFTWMEDIAGVKNMINAATLLRLLDTYDHMHLAFVKYLPLELAILDIIGNNE